jgi:hypothetical protein
MVVCGLIWADDLTNRLIDRRKALRHRHKRFERMIDKARRKMRTLAHQELEILSHGIGHDQNVGKQDCSVKAETAQRLHRDLGRCRVCHRPARGSRPFPPATHDIPEGIVRPDTHEPDRALITIGTTQRIEEQTGHREVQSKKIILIKGIQ